MIQQIPLPFHKILGTYHANIGWCDMSRRDCVCVALPKVDKASNCGIIADVLANVYWNTQISVNQDWGILEFACKASFTLAIASLIMRQLLVLSI